MEMNSVDRFNIFMSQLKETNATLSFYSDFKKISRNVADIEISLNTLNYLIGKPDLQQAVEILWERDSKVFDVLDILIATRRKDNKMFFDEKGNMLKVHSLFSSVNGVMKFLNETGFAEVLREQQINNLVDYVFGVETGLDTNARKNRSGIIMEKLIENILKNAGIKFDSQVSSRDFPKISAVLGKDQKVFDFVIKTHVKTYLVEVNFYSGGGSKLNEVARSYSEVAPKVNGVEGYEFIWITDGKGWNSAKNKLQEAFVIIPQIYNLTTVPLLVEKLNREQN